LIRTWTAYLAVAACLLSSGTAFGSPAYEEVNASLDRFALLDHAGRLTGAYRIVPDRLDLAIDTAEPMQQEFPAGPGSERTAVPSVGYYVKEFIPDLWGGTKRIFYRDNAPLVLIGMGLTGLAFTVDHRVQDYFLEKNPMKHPANIGDKIGAGYFPVGVGLALLGAGEWLDDKKMADTGVVTLESLLVTVIATEGLKFATGRKRPDGSDHLSFPSGHSSSTASLAASVSEMYDWDLRIAVPLYVVTAFVGASRIQANQHHLSDVIAGITLGTLVGSSFAKYQKEKDHEKGSAMNIAIVPLLDGSYKGMVFNWKF
jgi:membrane-associated phospholipid phosphatase